MYYQSKQSYRLMKSERALKLSLSPTRAPQDIIITVASLGWIKDTKAGGKSACMNCYQGEYNNKHSSNQYTYIFHARAEIGSQVQVPRVVMRVVCNDDDNPIKTVPAKKISAGSWREKVHFKFTFRAYWWRQSPRRRVLRRVHKQTKVLHLLN